MALCQIIRLIMFIVIGFMVLNFIFMDYKRSVALFRGNFIATFCIFESSIYVYYLSVVIPVDFNRYYIRFRRHRNVCYACYDDYIRAGYLYIALRKWRYHEKINIYYMSCNVYGDRVHKW